VRKNMHKHFVDVLDATVDSTPGMAIRKSPMMAGREDCIGRELWAWLVAWAKVWQRLGVESRDLTQIDRSHTRLCGRCGAYEADSAVSSDHFSTTD
jgi:hypothetical protein